MAQARHVVVVGMGILHGLVHHLQSSPEKEGDKKVGESSQNLIYTSSVNDKVNC